MEQRDVRYVSSLYGGFWNFDIKDFCYMTNPYYPTDEFLEYLTQGLRSQSIPFLHWPKALRDSIWCLQPDTRVVAR